MASATGCPRRRLPLLEGGGGEQPLARPPRLSGGGGGWKLWIVPRQEPGKRGADKRNAVGKGCAGGKEGLPGGETATLPFFHPHGIVEGPEARGRGNRMAGWGARGGDSLS